MTTIAVVVRCGFCKSVVTRSVDAGGEDAGYCNPQHRKAAYKRRARQKAAREEKYLKKALAPGALCPTPYKMTFVTEELAWDFIAVTFPDDRVIRPYPCPCGALHIGHPKYAEEA
jgi:hypothetical protein